MPATSTHRVLSVEQGDEFLGCHGGEAVGDQFAYFVPVCVGVQGQPEGVAAPSEDEERWSGVTQHVEVFALSAERQCDNGFGAGDFDTEDVGEGLGPDLPPGPDPGPFLVGVGQRETESAYLCGDVVGDVVVVAALLGVHRPGSRSADVCQSGVRGWAPPASVGGWSCHEVLGEGVGEGAVVDGVPRRVTGCGRGGCFGVLP